MVEYFGLNPQVHILESELKNTRPTHLGIRVLKQHIYVQGYQLLLNVIVPSFPSRRPTLPPPQEIVTEMDSSAPTLPFSVYTVPLPLYLCLLSCNECSFRGNVFGHVIQKCAEGCLHCVKN